MKGMKRFISFPATVILLIVSFTGCSAKKSVSVSGVFEGTGQGIHGDVKVAVT